MKKTYIKPSIEILVLNAQKLLSGSTLGSKFFGEDVEQGETIEDVD